MVCCASCGIAEVDDVKLKQCACKLVRYCSVACQKEHRPQHKKVCKKQLAELRDEILFKQPESNHLGDCPICCLPLSIDPTKSTMMACCSKMICKGCSYANQKREKEKSLDQTCPFCRHPLPKSQEEGFPMERKRVEVNDPVALRQMGTRRYHEGDYSGAFECWAKAAELGDVGAHYELSIAYDEGHGAEKDKKKQTHHLEEAAIGGHACARNNLGYLEWNNGRRERAVKHWVIAAKLGYDRSLEKVKRGYTAGIVSKEEFAAALRAHQAAVDATKSPQRETAALDKRG